MRTLDCGNMTAVDISTVIKQCEDHLFPSRSLSVRERALYYHLLRHTHAAGKQSGLFALLPLAQALGVHETSAREDVRSLNEKGCIRIEERSRQGHLIRVVLPTEIEGLMPQDAPAKTLDMETLDFFNGRRFINAILEREGHRCFYCMKGIRAESCELDHAVSRVNGADHTYRNIVASCHECNTLKQAMAPADYLRTLFRKGKLSSSELEERLAALEQLQSGKLVPNVALVTAAI
jgi:hypothetical protein